MTEYSRSWALHLQVPEKKTLSIFLVLSYVRVLRGGPPLFYEYYDYSRGGQEIRNMGRSEYASYD